MIRTLNLISVTCIQRLPVLKQKKGIFYNCKQDCPSIKPLFEPGQFRIRMETIPFMSHRTRDLEPIGRYHTRITIEQISPLNDTNYLSTYKDRNTPVTINKKYIEEPSTRNEPNTSE